jgi:hypothetical protein
VLGFVQHGEERRIEVAEQGLAERFEHTRVGVRGAGAEQQSSRGHRPMVLCAVMKGEARTASMRVW